MTDSFNFESGGLAQSAIHIDTTLQIEQLKTNKRANRVKGALAQFRFVSTSSYAQHEFNRTFVRDLVFLHAKCEQCKTVGELQDAVGKSFSGGQANRRTRCIEIISGMLDRRPTSLDIACEMTWLKSHLEVMVTQAHQHWARSTTHQFDGTKCWRAAVIPRIGPNNKIIFELNQCRRGNIRCRVHSFFEENAAKFNDVARTCASVPNGSLQLQGIVKKIQAAASDFQSLCDDRECSKIGDAIIAIDSESVPALGANNDAEWIPISQSLNKRLINPVKGTVKRLSKIRIKSFGP